jgi:arylsulfatase
MPNKPNIVFIFSDQHRGDTMGSAGNPAVITPNLDRIAGEGVSFTRCSTNSPLCMPARASMMTGLHVSQHGVWNNDLMADPKGQSHVRNIREAGYTTALIGKTHLWIHGGRRPGTFAEHAREMEPLLRDWGFDYIHELTGPIASFRHNSYYTDYLASKGLLDKHRGYLAEYITAYMKGEVQPWTEPPCPLDPEDHLDAYTGRTAENWIKDYKGDKPFYLQVLFPGPHDPFDSPQSYRDLYRVQDMPVGTMDGPGEPVPPYSRMVLRWSSLQNMTVEQKQLIRTFYYGKVTLIDEYIGRIFLALKDKGLLENTWIIYNSDHGEMLGDHRMSHKIVFYEEAVNIPCIFRPPTGVKGWKSAGLTDHLDLTASMLDLAGAGSLPDSDSRSLIPQILDGPEGPKAQTGKPAVFSEVYGFSMVRDERYKLIVQAETLRPVEMFDTRDDPRELRNLLKDPALKAVRQELIEKYLKRLSEGMDKEKYQLFREETQKGMKEGRGPRWAQGIDLFAQGED